MELHVFQNHVYSRNSLMCCYLYNRRRGLARALRATQTCQIERQGRKDDCLPMSIRPGLSPSRADSVLLRKGVYGG